MSVIKKTGKFEGNIVLPIEYPFPLDDFQLHSAQGIADKKNLLVIAHTGCGKTICAELAIAYTLKRGKKVIYASPIKTLSNQKMASFSKKFSSVGIVTGDIQVNQGADVLIMTAEIVNNIINSNTPRKTLSYYGIPSSLKDEIGCIVFDEVHYMNDLDRGNVWTTLLNVLDPSIQIVMLSATVANPDEFASWISVIKKCDTLIIPTEKRIVPLKHYYLVNEKEYLLRDQDDKYYPENYTETIKYFEKEILKKYYKDHPFAKKYLNIAILNETARYLKKDDPKTGKNKLSAIFFCFNRKNCQRFANMIEQSFLESKESAEAVNTFKQLLINQKEKLEVRPVYQNLCDLIAKGVAFHHAGIAPVVKDAIEYLFDNGYIKMLFATETFAAGVDMPTRTVVFCGLNKPTKNGRRMLTTPEYLQMAGRAGRRGKDTEGTVYIIPVYEPPSKIDMNLMINGCMPRLESQMKFNYTILFTIGLNGNITFETFLKKF